MRLVVMFGLALGLGACAKGADAPASAAPPAPEKAEAAAPEKKAAAKPKAEVKKPPTARRAGKRGKPPIKWPDSVDWKPWDEARALSAETGKPMCLVVYADWCPRCTELAPAFEDPEVKALTAKMVMVKQDNDAKPDWLQAFSQYGGYVPRIFFFDAAGQVREDVTSGHPRYPYFYTPRNLAALKASMRKAVGG